MINLTFKSFVDFLHADHAAQRDVLSPYKFPSEESTAKRTYYYEAVAAIRLRHRGTFARADFLARAARLRADAAGAVDPRRRTRCLHNARVIEQYDALVGDKVAPSLSRPRGWCLRRGNVHVAVNPDLHLLVRKKPMVVKLWTSATAPTPEQLRALTQIMHMAAHDAGYRYPASAFVVIDIGRGQIHRGARSRSRLARVIDAGMKNIAALWPTLTPRPPRRRRLA